MRQFGNACWSFLTPTPVTLVLGIRMEKPDGFNGREQIGRG